MRHSIKKGVGWEALPFGRADLGAQAPSVSFLCFFSVFRQGSLGFLLEFRE